MVGSVRHWGNVPSNRASVEGLRQCLHRHANRRHGLCLQKALAEVFNKIWEDDLAAPGGNASTFTARLLICNTQVGGVIGK